MGRVTSGKPYNKVSDPIARAKIVNLYVEHGIAITALVERYATSYGTIANILDEAKVIRRKGKGGQ